MRYGSGKWPQLLIATSFVMMGATASADAGIPMIMVAWPAACLALLPIVLVEAVVARRILGLPPGKAIRASLVANIASTLIGIPLSWVVMLVVELVVTSQMQHLAIGPPEAWYQRLLAGLMMLSMAPWLPPIERGESLWMLPASMMTLSVGFFIASVFIERVVMRTVVPAEVYGRLRAWSWQANALSYSAIEILLFVAFLTVTWGDNWPF